MSPRKLVPVLLMFVFTIVSVSVIEAGECSGVIVYKDGSKYAKGSVSALVSGGGVTKTFYTDSKGNFRITWSSSSNLDKIYVKGKSVARNVKNGASGLRLTVP